MSEQFPGSKKETIREVSREDAVESLRKNPEERGLFLKWLDKRQAEAEAADSSKEVLKLNIEVAEIYREAGLIECAMQAFEDAAQQAFQEGDEDTYERLMDEVERLESLH